jgi:hypothetical protein
MDKSMFYETYSKRKQIRFYDKELIPEFSVIEDALHKAHDIVSSKQNLVPYKIFVVNNNKEINKGLYELSKGNTGTVLSNTNLLYAPYQFIYSARLVDDASKTAQIMTNKGHTQPSMNPVEYKNSAQTKNTCIEIGMHSTKGIRCCIYVMF